jgi:hypothetical protein
MKKDSYLTTFILTGNSFLLFSACMKIKIFQIPEKLFMNFKDS